MTSQIYKRVKISRVKAVSNILKVWQLAEESDKHDWYQEANNFALINIVPCIPGPVSDIQLKLNKACGIIAALSPLKNWDANKKLAVDLVNTGNCGHMGAFVGKARLILSSDGLESTILGILSGKKIQAFYLNIRYPNKAISLTIDRHALSVCLGHKVTESEEYTMTKKQYEFFSECYRYAATKLNVNPLLVQSVTWLVWRKIGKNWPVVQTSIKF
jgi:hypothetical protein